MVPLYNPFYCFGKPYENEATRVHSVGAGRLGAFGRKKIRTIQDLRFAGKPCFMGRLMVAYNLQSDSGNVSSIVSKHGGDRLWSP